MALQDHAPLTVILSSGYRNYTFKLQTASKNSSGHNRTKSLSQFSDCNLVFNRPFLKVLSPFTSEVSSLRRGNYSASRRYFSGP